MELELDPSLFDTFRVLLGKDSKCQQMQVGAPFDQSSQWKAISRQMRMPSNLIHQQEAVLIRKRRWIATILQISTGEVVQSELAFSLEGDV